MKKILFTILILLFASQAEAAYKVFYYNSFTDAASDWVDDANAANDSTANYAYNSGGGHDIATWNTNTSVSTNYGTISSVYVRPYFYFNKSYSYSNMQFRTKYVPDTTVTVLATLTSSSGPGEVDYDVTSISGSSWPGAGNWTWANLANVQVEIDAYQEDAGHSRAYRCRLFVYYTPVASTASWSAPSAGSTHYRAGSGVAISGTAANANGINAVQYKVDSGSWVACSGTTSWSATIPQSSLTHGSHTITIRVQDASTDYAWTTIGTTRTITQSPLPAQVN